MLRLRKFSTSSAPRQLFAVVAQDYPGAEGVQKRLANREQHLAKAKQNHAEGAIRIGGALLDSHEKGTMIGSLLVIEADSLDKARELVEADVYVRGNVWKSWEIIPFKAAIGLSNN